MTDLSFILDVYGGNMLKYCQDVYQFSLITFLYGYLS